MIRFLPQPTPTVKPLDNGVGASGAAKLSEARRLVFLLNCVLCDRPNSFAGGRQSRCAFARDRSQTLQDIILWRRNKLRIVLLDAAGRTDSIRLKENSCIYSS